MSKYINPFTDFGFKKLFGEEDSKDILIGFLNDLLPIKDKIKSIEFKKSEQLGVSDISRKAIYDVYCTDEKGSRFIVEMQNASQTYFKDRTIFYSTFPIQEQAQPGEWNFKLTAVYCVSLIKFNMENGNDYLHTVKLKNQNNDVFYDKLTYFYVELAKFNKGENELETNFDKWLYFLKNLEDFNSIPDILKNTIFEKAFNKAELANFNETQKLDYERSVKIYRDNCNVIQSSFDDGIEQGMEQGIGIGMEQGILISKREDILENLSELGSVSADLIFKIENQCDVEILKKWLKFAIKSDSIEEFRKIINI